MSTTTEAPTVARVMDRLSRGLAVNAAELMTAEANERLAAARAEAARQVAADEAEADRQQRVQEVRAGLPKALDRAALEKARQKMARAVDEWAACCAAYDDALSTAHAALGALGPLPPGLVLDGHGHGSIVDGAVTYRRASVQSGVVQAAETALRVHYPRTEARLGGRPD